MPKNAGIESADVPEPNGAARTEFRMLMAECGDCGAVSTQEGGTRPSADQLCGGYTFSPQTDDDITGANGYLYDWSLGLGFHYNTGGVDLSFDYANEISWL